jgi:NAD(P)-dependent dehydrogenase (short-subunit alcohol dehydrogenase family)
MTSFQGTPLASQHAVVTGGAQGIGLAIANQLAGLGASVTIMDRNVETLESQAAIMTKTHDVAIQSRSVDVSDHESVDQAFATIGKSIGEPTILVNNAGIAPSAPFLKTSPDLWEKVIGVDLTGAFFCIQKVLPAMLESKFGRIVNISSTAGLTGIGYVTAYCAAKHGLIGLTRSLAIETARKGVTVNAVCPGFADTDIVKNALDNIVSKTGRTREEALANIVSHNPQGRLIKPSEIAEAVAWLCMPTSSSITGQSIAVAGGEIM